MTSKAEHQSYRRQWNSISRTRLRADTAALAFAGVVVKGITATPSAQAQALTTLHSFDYNDGQDPTAALVQATNGNLYGTTYVGGADLIDCFDGCGTVFKITPGGTLTTLYSFCSQSGCTDGASPSAGLVQATDGNFYGTTTGGGAIGDGTIFKITQTGTLTTLHSFDGTDGASPAAALVQATDGNLYGTTFYGGANSCIIGHTNVGCGTVFKITPGGTLTTLRSFDGTDGQYPNALVQATNGNLYGTTSGGGADGGGTIFKITPGGTLTTLYNFCSQSGCTDGEQDSHPAAGLVQATDGNLYGTTPAGGADGYGTVFKITPGGTLTTLHSFESTEAASPEAALVQDTNGSFYGTSPWGGAYSDGMVFSLSVGLSPFVETLPTSGRVGTAVKILGTNLSGATRVSFNGKAAFFKVVSNSEITTAVPAGATTGKVKVVTPSRTLLSNVPFRVP